MMTDVKYHFKVFGNTQPRNGSTGLPATSLMLKPLREDEKISLESDFSSKMESILNS